jgi:hypothetical protein
VTGDDDVRCGGERADGGLRADGVEHVQRLFALWWESGLRLP